MYVLHYGRSYGYSPAMTENTPQAPLLTTAEVAELLGVSTDTVLRWVQQRKLAVVKINATTVRYRPSDVDEFINERLIGASP